MLGSLKVALHALPLLATAATAAPAIQFPFGRPGRNDDGQIDLSKYTIGQILNYTLHHRGPGHDHEHHGPGHGILSMLGLADPADDGDEHRHPRGPPLYKLAYIVNRTESIKEYLSDPDISVTLFAPDDDALRPPPGHGPPHHGHGPDHGDRPPPGHGPPHHGAGPDHGDRPPPGHEPPHPPPGHGPPHHGDDHDHGPHSIFNIFKHSIQPEDDDAASAAPRHHPFHSLLATDDDEHDHEPTDEDKRRFIKKLIEAVLRYHISPSELTLDEIKDKQTIPTVLNQTKDTDVPFRIRSAPKLQLFPPPPSFDVKLNFYAGLRRIPAIKAKNGIIHLIGAPLLPPLTPLDQLLAFPIPFSTLTSAIQQTELDSALAPWLHHHGHEHEKEDAFGLSGLAGSMNLDEDSESATVISLLKELVQEATAGLPKSDDFKAFPFTIFAPTNVAFAKIPFKIRTFLFSPFGRSILKKVLSFHVVPQYILHSDYQLNATRSGSTGLVDTESISLPDHLYDIPEASALGDVPEGANWEMPKMPRSHGDDKSEVERYVLPTVLGSRKNESLSVNVYSYRKYGKGPLVKSISVGNYEQSEEEYTQVWITDGVAWGGAVHVINSLIRPPMPHHGEHGHPGHGHGHGPGHGREGHADYFKSLYA